MILFAWVSRSSKSPWEYCGREIEMMSTVQFSQGIDLFPAHWLKLFTIKKKNGFKNMLVLCLIDPLGIPCPLKKKKKASKTDSLKCVFWKWWCLPLRLTLILVELYDVSDTLLGILHALSCLILTTASLWEVLGDSHFTEEQCKAQKDYVTWPNRPVIKLWGWISTHVFWFKSPRS